MHALNPNYLINIANLLILVSFSVRDVLLLRILFLTGSVFAIGYYFLQSPPQWDPIAWTVLYCAIHGYWIVRILMERRPVELTPDEETLYRLAFSSLDRRKFARLAGFGRRRNADKGQTLSRQGERVNEILVFISGTIAAGVGDRPIGTLKPGHPVGTAGVLLNNIQECDFVVETPGRYIAWPLAEVQQFLERDPDLRAQVRDIMSADLAAKIHAMTLRMRSAPVSQTSGQSNT
jgi:CRP-like cAMP-binding protein